MEITYNDCIWRDLNPKTNYYLVSLFSISLIEIQNLFFKGVLAKIGSNKYKTIKSYTINTQIKTDKRKK